MAASQFTHTLGTSYHTDAGTIASVTAIYVADSESNLDDTVPGSTTNKEFDLSITKSDVVSMIMYSNQAVTIKTNSSSSPSDTISLATNMPLVWNTDSPVAIPLAGPVTKIYVTNAGVTAAALKIRVLMKIGV
jgi:hypothetical protein